MMQLNDEADDKVLVNNQFDKFKNIFKKNNNFHNHSKSNLAREYSNINCGIVETLLFVSQLSRNAEHLSSTSLHAQEACETNIALPLVYGFSDQAL